MLIINLQWPKFLTPILVSILADYNDFDLANKKHNSPIDNKFLEEFEFPSLTKNIDKKCKET